MNARPTRPALTFNNSRLENSTTTDDPNGNTQTSFSTKEANSHTASMNRSLDMGHEPLQPRKDPSNTLHTTDGKRGRAIDTVMPSLSRKKPRPQTETDEEKESKEARSGSPNEEALRRAETITYTGDGRIGKESRSEGNGNSRQS